MGADLVKIVLPVTTARINRLFQEDLASGSLKREEDKSQTPVEVRYLVI